MMGHPDICVCLGRSPAVAAASGILATVIPFGQSVGDSMDLPRCFATLRLPCQARGLHAICASYKTGGAQVRHVPVRRHGHCCYAAALPGPSSARRCLGQLAERAAHKPATSLV